jgi:hypothetical protein
MARGEVFIGIIVLLVVVVARLVGGGASVRGSLSLANDSAALSVARPGVAGRRWTARSDFNKAASSESSLPTRERSRGRGE